MDELAILKEEKEKCENENLELKQRVMTLLEENDALADQVIPAHFRFLKFEFAFTETSDTLLVQEIR